MVVLNEDVASAEAIVEKNAGNGHYLKKDFKKALECYDRAIAIDATNATFYTNKAAVFFEQGEHEKCRETCLKAIDVGRTYKSDPKLIAKAFGRIGNSFLRQRKYIEAKEFFMKSLGELETSDIKEKLTICQKEISGQERLAYINPSVSLVEKEKGDEALKSEDFESSLRHYTESIKRNPEDAKLYLSRAAVYMKLSMHNEALADSQNCITKDSNLVKGYICKGAALESLERFDDALDAYAAALDIDPSGKEASKAYFWCIDKDYHRRNTTDVTCARVMENHDVKVIMSDPEIKELMKDVETNPDLAHWGLKNPSTAEKMKKLLEYGLLKLG